MRLDLLFSATLFLSAMLLFWIEPMIARLFLPALGGTPAVWNTCMVFFQAALLAGYALAHYFTSRLKLLSQLVLLALMAFGSLLSLPPRLDAATLQTLPQDHTPVFWLIQLLCLRVGIPFLCLSILGPLLQAWFARARSNRAGDPYFLYVASNVGSVAGLLSYPTIVERTLTLRAQGKIWAILFFLEIGLVLLCAAAARPQARSNEGPSQAPGPAPGARLFWIWTALAFIPSSLLLGVTTYLTTDIASIPLLWIVPLSLYLLTFILSFAGKQWISRELLVKAVPPVTIGLIFLLLTEATEPVWLLIFLHLLFFFFASLLCHGRVAALRPSAQHLTIFYLALSFGGMLGGFFNALLAPVLFKSLLEYPIAILLATLALPLVGKQDASAKLWDIAIPLALAAVVSAILLIGPHLGFHENRAWRAVVYGIPLFLCFFAGRRPLRFALALGAVFFCSQLYVGAHGAKLYSDRNFFGVLRVTYDPAGPFHRLYHGTTIHGLQFVEGKEVCKPLSYYHPDGPLGDVFLTLPAANNFTNVGAVGLGAGAVISYSKASQNWTFYEIDPGVIKVAQDTNFFTFLSGCGGAHRSLVLGDARLRLREAAPAAYDLLLLDAFSSGMIPTHLITREAMELYLSKLQPKGIIAFHISSRHLDLKPVVASLARDAGLFCIDRDDSGKDEALQKGGDYATEWVLMARDRTLLEPLLKSKRWQALHPVPGFAVWSDDFLNILSVFIWK
jgi:hypothetical protein